MPTIHDFGSFKLYIYFGDHNPPHVHLIGPDFAAKMKIDDLSIMTGEAPAKAIKKATAYMQEHQAEVQAQWDQTNGQTER